MKAFNIVLFISLNSIIMFSQTNTKEYYKHLVFRETPYSQIQGRIPLDKNQSSLENYFKFSLDSKGRIVQLKYCYGDLPISLDRVGFMDGTGDLAPIVNILYTDNLEIRTYADEKNIPTSNGRGVTKMIYEYNEKGQRVSLKYFDKNDMPINDIWGICEYYWEHLDHYKVLEKRTNVKGDYVPIRPFYNFMDVIYTYNEIGLLISMENVDANGQLITDETGTAIDKPIYDKHYNLSSFVFLNQFGKPTIGSFYDAAGGIIEYDSKGNMIKYTTTDLNGKPRSGSKKDWAVIECDFDSKGNLIMESYFNENGTPALRKGAVEIKYLYQEKCNMIELKSTKITHF